MKVFHYLPNTIANSSVGQTWEEQIEIKNQDTEETERRKKKMR